MYIKKILLAVALLGLVVLGYFSFTIYQLIFSPNTSFQAEKHSVYVSEKADFQTVVDSLKPHLKDADAFVQVAAKKSYDQHIKSGHYVLTKGMNNNEIINALRSTNVPVHIHFNNQNSIQDFSQRLSEQLDSSEEEIFQTLTDSLFLSDNEMDAQQSLSLYIPNTYEFYWDSKPELIRRRLVKQHESFWTPRRDEKREALNLSRLDVSSLAAIVQKETSKVDERPRVAGVYVNRLKRGMRLQADPTLIYALKEKHNKPDTIIKRVLNRDKLIDSPFNTYLNAGVPPAPIAMPDISSIDAVLNYEEHDYFYFVADIENFGYHKFAKTLRQHNRYANKYRRWVNKQKIYR